MVHRHGRAVMMRRAPGVHLRVSAAVVRPVRTHDATLNGERERQHNARENAAERAMAAQPPEGAKSQDRHGNVAR
jgi:hypothetical protein